MNPYAKVKVNISEGQKDKIRRSVQAGTGVSLRLSHEDITGEHVLALNQRQINKITKAYQNGTGVTIKMSKTQLEDNAKVEGGFIGAILPFLATAGKFLLSSVLPSLATGALTGLGSAAGSKIVDKISGSGVLYVKKGGVCCKIKPAGEGLILSPWKKGSSITGSGLFMKRGSGYVSGEGLILGPNSPFKNIPILGMLL
jgi:hypothetical protein